MGRGGSGPLAGAPAGPASAALPIGGGGSGSTGAAAELSSSVRSAGGLLGSSPADAAGAAGTAGDYFFYQAAGELVLRHCKRCSFADLIYKVPSRHARHMPLWHTMTNPGSPPPTERPCRRC